MTVATTYKTTSNLSTEGVLATDVYKYIFRVGEPSEAPLVALTGGMEFANAEDAKGKKVDGKIQKEIATEIDYKVTEKDLLARTGTVATAVADTTTTTVVMDSVSNFRVGDVLRNKSQFNEQYCNSEVLYVYAISSPNLSCRRNIGSTSFTIAASDTLVVVGNAMKQGGSKATMISQLAAQRTRYVQIIKRSFGVTRTSEEVELLLSGANKPMDEEFIQAQIETRKDIEYSFWFNAYADSTTDTGAATVYLTRGIIGELANNDRIMDCNGLTEDKFFGEISEKIFEYGNQRKMLILSPAGISTITKWARVKLQMKPADTTYGININTVETNHGILDFTRFSGFSSFFPAANASFGVVLDLPYVRYKHISNRDMKVDDKINTPGDDVYEKQIIAEVGLSLRVLKSHLALKNFKE